MPNPHNRLLWTMVFSTALAVPAIGSALPVVFRDFQNRNAGVHDTPSGAGDMLLYGNTG